MRDGRWRFGRAWPAVTSTSKLLKRDQRCPNRPRFKPAKRVQLRLLRPRRGCDCSQGQRNIIKDSLQLCLSQILYQLSQIQYRDNCTFTISHTCRSDSIALSTILRDACCCVSENNRFGLALGRQRCTRSSPITKIAESIQSTVLTRPLQIATPKTWHQHSWTTSNTADMATFILQQLPIASLRCLLACCMVGLCKSAC